MSHRGCEKLLSLKQRITAYLTLLIVLGCSLSPIYTDLQISFYRRPEDPRPERAAIIQDGGEH
jgi:hypothetical protein